MAPPQAQSSSGHHAVMDKSRLRSPAWDFFIVNPEDSSTALCQLKTHTSCRRPISRGGKNPRNHTTSNMTVHLNSYHLKEFKAAKLKHEQKKEEKESKTPKVNTYFQSDLKTKKKKTSSSASCSSSTSTMPSCDTSDMNLEENSFILGATCYKQQSMEESFHKYWDEGDARSKELDFKIGEMIAMDNLPYSVVENLGFQRLMKAAKPKYNIPGRTKFSEKIVPTIYKTAFKCVEEMINNVDFLSFTTDFWCASACDQFLSLTAHCIFENFDQQAVVLHAMPFKHKHTGENINETIDKMISNFNIPTYKIHSIVHDNASNMVKGIGDSNYDSLPCFIHTSQLALDQCIFQQPCVTNLISKCKNLHSHFSKSYSASDKFHDIQRRLNHPVLNVLNECPTRWDSKYLMFQRALQLKVDIAAYACENPCPVEFHNQDWELMAKVTELLSLFLFYYKAYELQVCTFWGYYTSCENYT